MKITLSHGNGGMETSALIEGVFLKHFGNEISAEMGDAAILQLEGRLAFTTDSFVVKPVFFPGGDIGRLAVCGTVNDILTTGGTPRYLSASFILEEGLDTADLEKIAASMQSAAAEAGVQIVTGDTKVIDGNGGVYINTAGIGLAPREPVRIRQAVEGDAVVVTGSLGDHHACILSHRLGIENTIRSDVAPLTGMVGALQAAVIPLHGMRDITRGGLATVLNEIATVCSAQIAIDETALPVSEEVGGLCKILGLDPLYMGNEGKMLLLLPEEQACKAVNIIRSSDYGENAAVIGRIQSGSGVVLRTKLGGHRRLAPLTGEGLPRIC